MRNDGSFQEDDWHTTRPVSIPVDLLTGMQLHEYYSGKWVEGWHCGVVVGHDRKRMVVMLNMLRSMMGSR